MTLAELLNAITNTDTLFSISDGTNQIATLTGDSADALSAAVQAYTVTSFTINNKTSISVVVSTT